MRNDSSVSTGRIRAPKHQAGSCRSFGTVDAAMIRPMFFHFVSKLRQISGQRSLHRALLFAVRQRCVLYVRAFWSSRRRIGATKRSTHPTGNIGDSRSARNHRRAKSQSCGFRPQRPIPHPLIQMSGDQSKAATDRTPVHTTGTTYTPSPYILALYRPQRLPRWFAK